MAYVTQQQVIDAIGAVAFQQVFDEAGSGDQAQVTQNFNTAAATAQMAVDGPLAAIYAVPFSAPPIFCTHANLVLLLEMMYKKRLVPMEQNPWKDQADIVREQLDRIRVQGTGLDYNIDRGFFPGAAILIPSAITGDSTNTTIQDPDPAPNSL